MSFGEAFIGRSVAKWLSCAGRIVGGRIARGDKPGAAGFDPMRTEGDGGHAANRLSQPAAAGTASAMSRGEAPRDPAFDRMRAEGDSASPENRLSQPR